MERDFLDNRCLGMRNRGDGAQRFDTEQWVCKTGDDFLTGVSRDKQRPPVQFGTPWWNNLSISM
jgi:hypothetical protein